MSHKYLSIPAILMAWMLLSGNSCKENKPKSENIQNAKSFFTKLTKSGGQWMYEPKDSTMPFTSLYMKFESRNTDSIYGIISGLHESGETFTFWNIKEFIDQKKKEVVFQQSGSMGYTSCKSLFPSDDVRTADFEITYSNETKVKHRDKHTFISKNQLLTESEIYDSSAHKWMQQPETVWTRTLQIQNR